MKLYVIHHSAAVGAVAVEHAGEHEHQVREAVEVLARGGAQVFGFADGHDGAFGAARHGAAHVRLCGGARAGGQDEFLKARQRGVVALKGGVQLRQRVVLEQLKARNGDFAAQIEELMLGPPGDADTPTPTDNQQKRT